MKKITSLIISIFLIAPFLMSVDSYADRSEKVQVIKTDNENHDTIIKKRDGSRWLVQHNRVCTSISTEFPVELITGGRLDYLKVNFNEKCVIYNMLPYGGEGKLVRVIRSDNELVRDHEAEIIWKNKKYLIDFDGSCRLYEFEDKDIYYNFSNGDSNGGEIVLPSNRGVCTFTFQETIEVLEDENPNAPGDLKGLDFEERNNMVYFYWKPMEEEGKWLYIISYSRYPLELDSYKSWREMPNLRLTKRNSYTMRRLQNDRKYYFYLTALNQDGVAGEWSQLQATPVFKGEKIINQPDLDEFEITMEEKDDHFRLEWPARDDARRNYIRFFVEGKQQFFRILKPEINYFEIPKKEEYLGKGLKFTIRTIPYPTKQRYSDGIYWEYKE